MAINVTVKWGRQKLVVALPPDAKLLELRRALADKTGLPEHSFKLIHHGAVMKDDNAPISAYDIRDNATLVLLESSAPRFPPPIEPHAHSTNYANVMGSASRPHAPLPSDASEQSFVTEIRLEKDNFRMHLMPSVDAFLRSLSPSSSTPAPRPSDKALEAEHRRLTELLLQSLLRLDAFTPNGAWETARRERKGAVHEVQHLLNLIDEAWASRSK